MKKITMTTAGLLSAVTLTTNVYAEDIVYGEDIPVGKEENYEFLEYETILDAYKDLSSEEANELKISLEKSGYTTVTVKTYKLKTGVTTSKFEKEFDSYEDALKEIKALEEKGIVVDNIKFVNNTKTTSSSIDDVYTDLDKLAEDLKTLKENFGENYTEDITENEKDPENDATLEEQKEVVLDESIASYKTLEDAQAALDAFLKDAKNNTETYYFTGTVSELKEDGTTHEEEFTRSFKDAEELKTILESLTGKTVGTPTITYEQEEVEGTLNVTKESKKAAEDALDAFLKEYNINGTGSVKENKTSEVIEEQKEVVLDESIASYKTLEDAQAALDAFLKDAKNNTETYYFTGTVSELKEDGTTHEESFSHEVKDSDDLASYLKSLADQGYSVTSYNFVPNTHNEDVIIDETYDKEELANDAKTKYETQYPEDEFTVEEIPGENTKEEKIKSDLFDTAEEAQTELEKLIEKNHEYEITGSDIKTEIVYSTVDETYEEHKFDSLEDVENELERLQKLGYDTSDIKVDLATITESVIVDENGVVIGFGEQDEKSFSYSHFDIKIPTSFTLVKDSIESTINGTLTVSDVTIKNNGKTTTVTMTGPSNDETGKYKEYASKDRSRLSVTNKSYVSITGTVTYKDGNKSITLPYSVEGYLSEAENECGGVGRNKGYDLLFRSIKIINEKVYIDSNIINIYKVSGTLHKEVPQTKYYFETQKTNFNYKYKLTGTGTKIVTEESGTVTGKMDVPNEGYFLNLQKKKKTYTAVGTGKKKVNKENGTVDAIITVPNEGYFLNLQKKQKSYTVKAYGEHTEELESGVLTADLTEDVYEDFYALDLVRQKFEFVMGEGDGDGEDEEENPKTADNVVWAFTFGGFSAIGLAVSAHLLKKEEDQKILL